VREPGQLKLDEPSEFVDLIWNSNGFAMGKIARERQQEDNVTSYEVLEDKLAI
jgi:hypothetical protein